MEDTDHLFTPACGWDIISQELHRNKFANL